MMALERAWIPVLIGVAAGFLSGLLGVGGGIIIVPLLVMYAGLSQHQGHATSLAAIVPIAAVGAATFAFNGEIDFGVAALLSLGALLGAPLGAKIMLASSERTLRALFAGLMIVSAVVLLIR